jgi:hypothetical protein
MKRSRFILPVILVTSLLTITSCGYDEKGHSNTPPENPGSQVKTGVDTTAHPGNIDRDSIHLEK